VHALEDRPWKAHDSYQRGHHDINNELVFGSNPGFVFHDSCGFEAGGEDEFQKMKEFVSERASTTHLKKRIHAIWQAIIYILLCLILIFSVTGIASQWMSTTEPSRWLRKSFFPSVTPTTVHRSYNILDPITDNGASFSSCGRSVYEIRCAVGRCIWRTQQDVGITTKQDFRHDS